MDVVVSSFEREYAEWIHVLHGHMKLDLNCPSWLDSSHLTAIVFRKKLSGADILCVFAIEKPEDLRYQWTGDWSEQVDVSGVCAWLGWYMHSTVTTDLVST